MTSGIKIEANTIAFKVQLLVINVLAALIGVAAKFIAGTFLAPFVLSLLVVNIAWYFFIYRRKRVTAIEFYEQGHELALNFNRPYESIRIDLDRLQLRFEEERGQNDNMVTVLAIYDSSALVNKIRPGMTGFDLDSLRTLVSRYETYISEKATP